jgi:hypothetical protein
VAVFFEVGGAAVHAAHAKLTKKGRPGCQFQLSRGRLLSGLDQRLLWVTGDLVAASATDLERAADHAAGKDAAPLLAER